MKVFVVLSTDRTFVESIEGNVYKIFKPYFKDDGLYLDILYKELDNKPVDAIYPISDFMDMYNNNEIDISVYFIGYIFVN